MRKVPVYCLSDELDLQLDYIGKYHSGVPADKQERAQEMRNRAGWWEELSRPWGGCGAADKKEKIFI